jgi:hypothetical protein
MRRRSFLKSAASAAAAAPLAMSAGSLLPALAAAPSFAFARARYGSGNWDTDGKMPSNILNSLVEYTSIRVDPSEPVVALDSTELFAFPFVYLSGNELVRFTARERENVGRYVHSGGFLFVDDCNHDVDGVFARTFEAEMNRLFTGDEKLRKVNNDHDLYRSFFEFPDGPPATSHELNGWGDDMIHDYLKAVHVNGRIGVLYSNKDYGCEWNYDYASKRFAAVDNTKFGVNIVVHALTH